MRFFHGQLSHDRFLKTFIQVQLRCTSWAHVAGARNDRSFSLCVVHFVSPIRGMGWIVWVRSVSSVCLLALVLGTKVRGALRRASLFLGRQVFR